MEKIDRYSDRERRAVAFDRVLTNLTHIEGFEGKTPAEVFDADPQHITELFENINAEQYKEILDGINGVLRGKSRDLWGYDGDGVTIRGEADSFASAFFPDQKAKTELIEKSFEVAKTLVADGRDISEIAYLLASIVAETHPYADGNGRTGRVIYELLANGYDSGQIKDLLNEEGRSKLNVSIPKRDFTQPLCTESA